MRLQVGDGLPKGGRGELVVRIELGDVLPPGGAESDVERGRDHARGIVEHPDRGAAPGQLLGRLDRAVGRAAVHDQDLEVTVVAGEHAAYRPPDVPGPIIHGNHHADRGPAPPVRAGDRAGLALQVRAPRPKLRGEGALDLPVLICRREQIRIALLRARLRREPMAERLLHPFVLERDTRPVEPAERHGRTDQPRLPGDPEPEIVLLHEPVRRIVAARGAEYVAPHAGDVADPGPFGEVVLVGQHWLPCLVAGADQDRVVAVHDPGRGVRRKPREHLVHETGQRIHERGEEEQDLAVRRPRPPR